jgi:teichuronic acid biosynthesis glycosyltransferase TuaC
VKIRPQEQLRLVMVGKGPMDAAVRTEAIKLGIAAQLTLTGPQDASQVGEWMRRSEMLCMTSRNEGLPNVVLEAQACGLPVVATNVGGIHECVDEDWKGTLVPLDNANAWTRAAADLLDHPADRQRIAILGASRNWAATAGLYRDVIEAAITPVRSP